MEEEEEVEEGEEEEDEDEAQQQEEEEEAEEEVEESTEPMEDKGGSLNTLGDTRQNQVQDKQTSVLGRARRSGGLAPTICS